MLGTTSGSILYFPHSYIYRQPLYIVHVDVANCYDSVEPRLLYSADGDRHFDISTRRNTVVPRRAGPALSRTTVHGYGELKNKNSSCIAMCDMYTCAVNIVCISVGELTKYTSCFRSLVPRMHDVYTCAVNIVLQKFFW